ncbi:U-box domain-containing protein 35-like [Canna indica]|uniref:RING-type E3 ubiquitin transferase n=1 Tax=Canna indica TaxID=4628 RepID=A0AAQ3K1T4_9LILI|nr:U-box domain-containing protein 35-like [Canna indica]
MEEGDRLLQNSVSTIALAVSGTKKPSKYVIQWAMNKFISEDRIKFKLLNVQPTIKMVPTPMGNYIPIDQVRDDVAAAYRKDEEWRIKSMLQPYKKMCTVKKIETELVVLEADDVAEAIAREITKNTISKLVIGASSKNALVRKLRGGNLSSRISECTPSFCTVYVISKGKLSSVRSSASRADETPSLPVVDGSIREENYSTVISCSFSSNSSSSRSESVYPDAGVNFPSQFSSMLPQIPRNLDFTSKDHETSSSVDTLTGDMSLFDDSRNSISNISETQYSRSIASMRSFQTDKSWNFDISSSSYNSRERSPSRNEGDIDLEFERLRTEINHFMGMFKFATKESSKDSQQLDDTQKHQIEEMLKFQESLLRLEKANKMSQQEKERAIVAKSAPEGTDNQSFERTLSCGSESYMKYNWEDIVAATMSFSSTHKIGVGANGTVYRGNFHHTVAAIKVLHSDEGYSTKQFKQELEVLSRVHHPHVLLLLGACPERGCLVYEYMENGSLEDRLQCKNNTLPLPWFCRFRIVWEVACALVFLHNSKPEPIIHRDLKPANILLDNNFVSKIGDAGLSTLLPTLNMPLSTIYKDTAPVGTFFYMDPEYQRTGLVSAKSDTYALGMVILQLLTGQSPMGLALTVETALEKDSLIEILDPKAGQWPEAEAKELAILGLSCLELRRKDRPDLNNQVLLVLERLKDVAEQAHDLVQRGLPVVPSHFICPLLKIVMDDPCIASDGYTYNRNAIRTWLERNDKSPMTNSLLPNKDLIPNNSLLSAIREWKSRTQ